MKRLTFFLAALATLGGVVAFRAPASGQTDAEAAPSYGVKIPPGYRDWRLISVAHEEGNFNSFAAVLGNDVAIKAYREGNSHSRTAQSLPLCTTVTSHRRKTTRSLAEPNPSLPAPRRTFSLWSRTRKSTRRRAAGRSLTSKTASLPTKR